MNFFFCLTSSLKLLVYFFGSVCFEFFWWIFSVTISNFLSALLFFLSPSSILWPATPWPWNLKNTFTDFSVILTYHGYFPDAGSFPQLWKSLLGLRPPTALSVLLWQQRLPSGLPSPAPGEFPLWSSLGAHSDWINALYSSWSWNLVTVTKGWSWTCYLKKSSIQS